MNHEFTLIHPTPIQQHRIYSSWVFFPFLSLYLPFSKQAILPLFSISLFYEPSVCNPSSISATTPYPLQKLSYPAQALTPQADHTPSRHFLHLTQAPPPTLVSPCSGSHGFFPQLNQAQVPPCSALPNSFSTEMIKEGRGGKRREEKRRTIIGDLTTEFWGSLLSNIIVPRINQYTGFYCSCSYSVTWRHSKPKSEPACLVFTSVPGEGDQGLPWWSSG